MKKTPLWLTYLFGWITGLIFLATEKTDNDVRWHAANSTAVFGAATAASIALSILGMIPAIGFLFRILGWIVGVVTFILWVVLIVNAANNSKFEVPVLTDFGIKNFINLFK
jgi:uncharacterized membrane protein